MNPANPYPPAAPIAPTHPELLVHTLALDFEHFNGPDPLPVRVERMRTRLKARMNELADRLAADIAAGKIKPPAMLKARLYLTPQAAPQQQAPVVRAPGRPVTASRPAEQPETEPAEPAADDDKDDGAPSPDPKRSAGHLQPNRLRELNRKGR